jgi:hypothetical protein
MRRSESSFPDALGSVSLPPCPLPLWDGVEENGEVGSEDRDRQVAIGVWPEASGTARQPIC